MSDYSAPPGAPTWLDLTSTDPGRAAEFYRALFGWETEAPPNPEFGGYQSFTVHGKPVAGLSPTMGPDAPADVWSVYLRTDDPEATVAAVREAGGSVIVPPMQVGDMGTMMVAADCAGAAIGFWKAGNHNGFTEWGTHGTPYWFENQSKDYANSTEFYRQVTGARSDEVGTGGAEGATGPERYAQLFFGDTAYAGIMDSAEVFGSEMPSYWQIYITVDDVGVAVDAAQKHGGSVVMGGEVTPYGTLAVIRDPFGALICLGHPPAGM